MTNEEPILPGLESALAKIQDNAMPDEQIEKLPTYTAERIAHYEPDRYELAARLLFAENVSRRTICKWLHMSPNTLSAIEVRELRLHPERIAELQEEAKAEIAQLKRMGREALRARFFDKNAVDKISAKELASILKLLEDMSTTNSTQNTTENANRNTEQNDYIDVVAEWTENRFGREKNSAPGKHDRLEDEARQNGESAQKTDMKGESADADQEARKQTESETHTIQQNATCK